MHFFDAQLVELGLLPRGQLLPDDIADLHRRETRLKKDRKCKKKAEEGWEKDYRRFEKDQRLLKKVKIETYEIFIQKYKSNPNNDLNLNENTLL